jgi:hypothetical protein
MIPNEDVNARLYEELEELAAVHEACTLQCRGSNSGVVTLQTEIRQLFEEDDEPYLLTRDGLPIKLREMVSVNGKPVAHFC